MSEVIQDNPALMDEPPPGVRTGCEQEPEKKIERAAVPVEAGSLVARDHRELGSILNWISKGGGFPERFKTNEQRIAAYNLSHSLMGAQWQLALNNIAIIKGQMCIYGELPGTLAERTREVTEKEVYLIDSDYKRICIENMNLNSAPFAAVCKIQRKHRAKKEFTYSMEQAIAAGQYPPKKSGGDPNPDSPWNKHLKTMLMRKAMALAIKFEFPDALVGVPIAEYEHDAAPDLVDVTPPADRAAELNRKFGGAQ
jgi:RecT family